MRIVVGVIAAVVLAAGDAGGAGRAGAQQVPLLSVEVTSGAGRHSMHTPHAYFRAEPAGLNRVAATLRLGSAGAVRPVLTIEYANGCTPIPGLACGYTADCPVAPDGSCEAWFQDPEGTAVALGVESVWGRHVEGTLAAGLARYDRSARYVDANVGVVVFSHVAVVADARQIFSTAGADHTWFFPLSLGLRIQ